MTPLHNPPLPDCDVCGELYQGDCPVHGSLLALDTSCGYDEDSLAFTNVPVPFDLTVAPSSIPGAGLGVFAKALIPCGVRFGPYKGRKVMKEALHHDVETSYMWEVR